MPTSRPLVEGDRVVAISLPLTVGDTYIFNPHRMNPEHVALCSDFSLPNRSVNNWWEVVGARVFGIANCVTADARLLSAIRSGTAPALYVREGDTVEPWSSYQAVLHERRLRALTERHAVFMNRLRHHGAGNIQLRVENAVVVIQCSGALPDPAILAPNIPEGVRVETLPAWQFEQTPTGRTANQANFVGIDFAEAERQTLAQAVSRSLPGLSHNQQAREMAERWAAAMNNLLTLSAAELGGTLADTPPPPPPPPPPPTRFNLLECDLPAVDPTPAKQKHFEALAELQAEFRAARVAAKTAVQPVLTRFDLLECDEPAEPVIVKPKWSTPQRPQPAAPRRPVEDILDLTTSGPLEALAALQIAKAEILRELRQGETN